MNKDIVMRRFARAKAQALVEFALAATLIFFLLAAAIDLGFIFLNLQTLRTAAQEGATFGSYPAVVLNNGVITAATLSFDEIRNRVRLSAGATPSGFTNLLDLDSDGVLDVDGGNYDTSDRTYDTYAGTRLPGDPNATGSLASRTINQYITIQPVYDANSDGVLPEGTNGIITNQNDLCYNQLRMLTLAGKDCYIRVIVRYRYRLVFPLTPAFADNTVLTVRYTVRIRSTTQS